jgi:hypothetical protein
MPRHLVSEAHLEAALLARDLWVDRISLIELAIFTEWREAPPKTRLIGENRLQEKFLISKLSETHFESFRTDIGKYLVTVSVSASLRISW